MATLIFTNVGSPLLNEKNGLFELLCHLYKSTHRWEDIKTIKKHKLVVQFLPDWVFVDSIIEQQDAEAEDSNQERVKRRHRPEMKKKKKLHVGQSV